MDSDFGFEEIRKRQFIVVVWMLDGESNIAPSGLGAIFWAGPGAARFASLRACPWLPYVAPSALVEWQRTIRRDDDGVLLPAVERGLETDFVQFSETSERFRFLHQQED